MLCETGSALLASLGSASGREQPQTSLALQQMAVVSPEGWQRGPLSWDSVSCESASSLKGIANRTFL